MKAMTSINDYMTATMARLNEIIAPAVLRDSQYNRQILMGEMARLNLGNPKTVEDAAGMFRKAVVSICNDPSRALNALVWNVEPTILAKYKVGKVENS
jgi:hypothetical protein